MSLGLLARQPVTWDSEAASYILQVEAADGQSLEPGVARAINTFVIDCKTRGIWGAIKSCCLLCGARTIAGATIPLKGNAPILTSFVGNYNRETGLQRTSGNFSINRNNNADPQNNKHIAVYPTSIDYGSSDSNSRSILTGSTVSGSTFFTVNSLGLSVRVNTSLNIVSNQPVFAGNLIGVSILDSSRSQLLYNSRINIININTTTPVTTDLSLFAGGGVATSLSRVAFYSVGENLDLRLLKQCIENYNNSLSRILTSSYIISDTDAATYIALVEAADKTSLSYSYRKAVNEFIIGCKSDNIWTSLKSSCILLGARTLSGILVPLVGTAPTNNGFVEVNYNRNLGLSNSSRAGWLDSNRNNNADPQDNQHMSVYITNPESTITEYQYIGVGTNVTGATHISTNINRRNRNGLAVSASSLPSANTLLAMSRSAPSSFNSRTNSVDTAHAISSQAPYVGNVAVFSRDIGNGKTNATLAFYSIGTSLDLSLLDNRVTTLVNELSAARSL